MTTRREFLQRSAASGFAAALCGTLARASDAAGHDRSAGRLALAQTVRGAIDAADLGFTLPHEHLADAPGVLQRWPKSWGGRSGLVTRAVERLEAMRAAGVRTVVDLTTYDVGRDIRFLEEASRKSGMQVIACTGQRFFPPASRDVAMPSRTIAGLERFFMKEIGEGIEGTSIKAGVIKIGIVGARPTALEVVGLRAAVRASKSSGLPIRVHTDAAHRAGENIAAVLEDEGMNPAKVSLDHSDDSGEMDYFLGLLRRGFNLSMDHAHRGLAAGVKPSYDRRTECIKALIDAGFVGQLFLSTDTEFGGWLLPKEARDWRENLDSPDGALFVVRRLLPDLMNLGVSSEQIRTMTVANPESFFSRSQVS